MADYATPNHSEPVKSATMLSTALPTIIVRWLLASALDRLPLDLDHMFAFIPIGTATSSTLSSRLLKRRGLDPAKGRHRGDLTCQKRQLATLYERFSHVATALISALGPTTELFASLFDFDQKMHCCAPFSEPAQFGDCESIIRRRVEFRAP